MEHVCYLSTDNGLKASRLTGLSLDEIEEIVGRFRKGHERAGQLKGELVQNNKGAYVIRHHFLKRKLWNENQTGIEKT